MPHHTPHLMPALPPKTARVDVVGTPFDLVDMAQVDSAIRQRQPGAPFEYVATPNVDHVVRSHRLGLRSLYDKAWLSVCDSRILAKLAPLVNVRFPAVITGSDLTKRVLENFLQPGDHIAIIGGEAEHIAKLKSGLGSVTVHHYNPPMGFIGKPAEVQKTVDFVLAHPSRFVFLAVGSPQQEKLAIRIKESGGTGTGLCIGASILFIIGLETRAPQWVQSIHMEWLFRLLQNPKRLWRRYLVDNPMIFLLVLKGRFGTTAK